MFKNGCKTITVFLINSYGIHESVRQMHVTYLIFIYKCVKHVSLNIKRL